jgi:hypothetical protein
VAVLLEQPSERSTEALVVLDEEDLHGVLVPRNCRAGSLFPMIVPDAGEVPAASRRRRGDDPRPGSKLTIAIANESRMRSARADVLGTDG